MLGTKLYNTADQSFLMLLPGLHAGTQLSVSGSLSNCQGIELPSGTTAAVQHGLPADCKCLWSSLRLRAPTLQ